MKPESGRAAFEQAFDVSRETMDRLDTLADELLRWSERINLVAPNTLPELWTRHIWDCAQVYQIAPPARTWADLGSGGGFPGLVVAILAWQASPEMVMHLVESDGRKCAFLRQMTATLGLKAAVHTARAETLDPIQAGIVSARALAPLPRLLPLVRRHLARGGTALLQKGRNWKAEIQDCQGEALGPFTAHPSRVDPDSVILEFTGLAP